MRVFDKPLGRQVGSRFPHTQQVCLTGSIDTGFVGQLDSITIQIDGIKTQLDSISQKIQSDSETPVETSLFQTSAPTKVGLYYFNQLEDQKLAPEQQVNLSSLLPVYRIFPASKNLLVDTINELIKGKLTAKEQQQWFITEFPNPSFSLLSAHLTSDGVLTLEFSEVPGFTDGWSARMLILSNLIKKTALQFSGVKKVVFVPEILFQP